MEMLDETTTLRKRVKNLYDAARHRPCPVERKAAISYIRLAARWFKQKALNVDFDIANMYAASLEGIRREVEVS